jgi:hypothetical protein
VTRWWFSVGLAAICAGSIGCGGSTARAPGGNAIIALACPVADAEVWVDGRFSALVGDFRGGMALSPGVHRIVVRHDQYHDSYHQLSVKAGERRVLDVQLAERL